MVSAVTPKLKASSLLEALVATVIVMTCFGIAVAIYSNVLRSDDHRMKLKARLILNDFAMKVKADKKFIDDKTDFDSFSITQKISKYKDANDLIELSFTFLNRDGKVLAKRDELVIEP